MYLEAPPMPDSDALSLARAIAHALYVAHEGEETPIAIVVDPATRHVLERALLLAKRPALALQPAGGDRCGRGRLEGAGEMKGGAPSGKTGRLIPLKEGIAAF
jgi:hypothetical protein